MPKSYLSRWEEQGRLRVTDVDGRKSFITSAAKAARETDFYRIASPDLDPRQIPPQMAEVMLGVVEQAGAVAIEQLLADFPRRPDPQAAAHLAWFLGFQLTRGVHFRRLLRDVANQSYIHQYASLSDEGVRAMLARRSGKGSVPNEDVAEARKFIDGLASGEYRVHPQDAALVGMAMQFAEEVGRVLLSRTWTVVETPAALVTCDEPVVLVGGPPLSRDQRPGIANAGAVVFPLSPGHLLVMFRADMATVGRQGLSHVELAEINREILGNATRWGFERPSRRATLALELPPSPSSPVVFDAFEVPGDTKGSRLIRLSGTTRWSADPSYPWPVQRWWLQHCR